MKSFFDIYQEEKPATKKVTTAKAEVIEQEEAQEEQEEAQEDEQEETEEE